MRADGLRGIVQRVERGAWRVERGAWSVERGAWGVGRGAWGVGRGAWGVESVERGAWSVERGAWSVEGRGSAGSVGTDPDNHYNWLTPKNQSTDFTGFYLTSGILMLYL
jgi:hypothetical protein